ncbi:helix-turn-helix domain-containing protein [Streptomyces niveus]|uniref:helix-turn-helix domain-containing protein n=1 Tax=Streptomyces niveus TaxID=193462 RepID=UPI003682567C
MGVGGPHPRLTEALFVRGSRPRCRSHPHHGPSGALIPDELAKGIHPGLRPLLSNPAYRGLVDTLRMYLDHAGDARRAAFTLHVHRST